jgi:hypothetical protein
MKPEIRPFRLSEPIWLDVGFCPIAGYECLYAVNRMGLVLSYPKKGHKHSPKILKPRKHSCGYLRVSLSKDKVKTDHYIHRLVAEAYIPNLQNLPQVNHKNGNKQDNAADNLEWNTDADNLKHAFKMGLTTSKMFSEISLAQSRKNRKLSFGQAQQIRQLYHNHKMGFADICRKFGVSDNVICGIIKNRTYKVA